MVESLLSVSFQFDKIMSHLSSTHSFHINILFLFIVYFGLQQIVLLWPLSWLCLQNSAFKKKLTVA